MVGLYAVTAHATSRRARDIGVRMALGAQPRQVRCMLLKRVMSQLALGFVGRDLAIGWSRMFSTGRAQVNVTGSGGARDRGGYSDRRSGAGHSRARHAARRVWIQ